MLRPLYNFFLEYQGEEEVAVDQEERDTCKHTQGLYCGGGTLYCPICDYEEEYAG